jgi:hypothetical protein
MKFNILFHILFMYWYLFMTLASKPPTQKYVNEFSIWKHKWKISKNICPISNTHHWPTLKPIFWQEIFSNLQMHYEGQNKPRLNYLKSRNRRRQQQLPQKTHSTQFSRFCVNWNLCLNFLSRTNFSLHCIVWKCCPPQLSTHEYIYSCKNILII